MHAPTCRSSRRKRSPSCSDMVLKSTPPIWPGLVGTRGGGLVRVAGTERRHSSRSAAAVCAVAPGFSQRGVTEQAVTRMKRQSADRFMLGTIPAYDPKADRQDLP